MSSLISLLEPSYIVSTTAGAGAVWGVVKVYIKFLLRDIDKLEKRMGALEEWRMSIGSTNGNN